MLTLICAIFSALCAGIQAIFELAIDSDGKKPLKFLAGLVIVGLIATVIAFSIQYFEDEQFHGKVDTIKNNSVRQLEYAIDNQHKTEAANKKIDSLLNSLDTMASSYTDIIDQYNVVKEKMTDQINQEKVLLNLQNKNLNALTGGNSKPKLEGLIDGLQVTLQVVNNGKFTISLINTEVLDVIGIRASLINTKIEGMAQARRLMFAYTKNEIIPSLPPNGIVKRRIYHADWPEGEKEISIPCSITWNNGYYRSSVYFSWDEKQNAPRYDRIEYYDNAWKKVIIE